MLNKGSDFYWQTNSEVVISLGIKYTSPSLITSYAVLIMLPRDKHYSPVLLVLPPTCGLAYHTGKKPSFLYLVHLLLSDEQNCHIFYQVQYFIKNSNRFAI